MGMTFFTISEQDRRNNIIDNIIRRETEIHHYELNIANYEAILQTLPTDEWPEIIEDYKNRPINEVPVELQDMVNNYSFRDRCSLLLSTEKCEMHKSINVYNALLTQINLEEIPELIKNRQAELAAKETK